MAVIRGRERKSGGEIFTASMADIVFLLIVFFVFVIFVFISVMVMFLNHPKRHFGADDIP